MKDVILKAITIIMIFVFMLGISALDSESLTIPVGMMAVSMAWLTLVAYANSRKEVK